MPKELDETCDAFVGNTGHFDSEIDLACSESSESSESTVPGKCSLYFSWEVPSKMVSLAMDHKMALPSQMQSRNQMRLLNVLNFCNLHQRADVSGRVSRLSMMWISCNCSDDEVT